MFDEGRANMRRCELFPVPSCDIKSARSQTDRYGSEVMVWRTKLSATSKSSLEQLDELLPVDVDWVRANTAIL